MCILQNDRSQKCANQIDIRRFDELRRPFIKKKKENTERREEEKKKKATIRIPLNLLRILASSLLILFSSASLLLQLRISEIKTAKPRMPSPFTAGILTSADFKKTDPKTPAAVYPSPQYRSGNHSNIYLLSKFAPYLNSNSSNKRRLHWPRTNIY